ncbi:hypothetical protein BHU72_04055 [Desulfuribacillus stibiiarsenatis]|uniref:Copper amine oxidase-like N-terminal domain-containing protein n=1 Tax=Desulfuribacillus stibiiarsenatis TaxID=1390249 RepID=A0A1E5L555_9FIRM|nr:copper amine oxidase N-terminal domain-containing protein [Desulfuribacillus stibiiarsenatis]OEH85277.1 hypothetical protein BHU72_04055 [Desulfuribacillus stibiiarsenatis]
MGKFVKVIALSTVLTFVSGSMVTANPVQDTIKGNSTRVVESQTNDAKGNRPAIAKEREGELQKQYLSAMQKLRAFAVSIKDAKLKAETIKEIQNIHITKDTIENKLARIPTLEAKIRERIARLPGVQPLASSEVEELREKLDKAAKIKEELGVEKALELRKKLADRKVALAAQKELKQEQKQALRARDVKDRLYIKGATMKFDVPPVIREGRTLVPVRAITEGLGAKVDWNPATKTITITKDDKVIVLVLGSATVTVNGVPATIDVPAQVTNNRTIVPIRFISEILKVSVEYDNETGDIDIGLDTLDNLELLEETEAVQELNDLIEEVEATI